MSVKRDRIAAFDVHRPVAYNEKAVQKLLDVFKLVYVDIKYDGIRGIIYYDAPTQRWRVVTRENIEILSVSERVHKVATELGIDKPAILDCEIVIPGIPFEEASGLLRRHEALPEDTPLEVWVFDALHNVTRTMTQRSLIVSYRPAVKVHNTTIAPVKRRVANSMEDIDYLYDLAREEGYEGIVIKDPSQTVINGKKAGWYKRKPKETVDGVITGFVLGTDGTVNEGTLVGFEVKLEDGSTCKATGLTTVLKAAITARPSDFLGRYVEVERMQSTDAGNSRHPHFKCFRDLATAKGIKS